MESKTTRVFSPAAFFAGVYAVVFVFGFAFLEVFRVDLFQSFGDLLGFLGLFASPDVSALDSILELAVQTLLIALAGSSLGLLIGLPLAYLSSESSKLKFLRFLARVVGAVFRAIPDLVFALIAVAVFGFGAFAGVLALGFSSAGMFARILADRFDQKTLSAETLKLSGTKHLAVFLASTIREHFGFIAQSFLYRMDINFRSATTLGLVGAGGIGIALRTATGSLNYSLAATVILVIAVSVLVIELASGLLAKAILQRPSVGSGLFFGVFGFGMAAGLSDLLSGDADLSRAPEFFIELLSPNLNAFTEAFPLLIDSLAMAGFGIGIGVVFGFVLGSVASGRGIWSFIARVLLIGIRSIPAIVLGIVFVIALGLGPVAGAFTLAITATSVLGKLTNDGLKSHVDSSSSSLALIGIRPASVFLASKIRSYSQSFVGDSFFVFDVVIRYSLVLGIVGAGGLGNYLLDALRVYDFQTVSTVIILILAVIIPLEALASRLKKRFG